MALEPSLSVPSLRWLGLGTGGLSQQDVFEILSNTRRRYAFHYLQSHDGAASLAELTDHVAAWEYDAPVGAVGSTERQRVYVSLRQTHLPRMDEAGVVTFDPAANTIELAANAADVEVYLESVPDDDILWAQTYLGIAGIGAVLLVPVWLGFAPFAAFPAVIGLFVALAFAGSAALHHRHLRSRRLGGDDTPI